MTYLPYAQVGQGYEIIERSGLTNIQLFFNFDYDINAIENWRIEI